MNIVIFGGGKPGRLGNLLGAMAQNQAHRVVSVSHRAYVNNQLDIIVADKDPCASLQQAVDKLGSVDMVLYCTKNHENTPITSESFDSGTVSFDEYNKTLLADVIVPHQLMSLAHQKCWPTHFVFFTTNLAVSFLQEQNQHHSTYIGGKAWQLHLMRAVASITSTVTATAFSIHFDWDNSDADNQKLEYLYSLVMSYRKNGAIVSAYNVNRAQVLELDILKHAPYIT